MAASLDVLVQDHFRAPRHHVEQREEGGHCCDGHNPLCGDKVRVYLDGDAQAVTLKFWAEGCSLSKAAASIACEVFRGCSAVQIGLQIEEFTLALTSDAAPIPSHPQLATLTEMQHYPVRRKCVQLVFDTILQCLDARREKRGP